MYVHINSLHCIVLLKSNSIYRELGQLNFLQLIYDNVTLSERFMDFYSIGFKSYKDNVVIRNHCLKRSISYMVMSNPLNRKHIEYVAFPVNFVVDKLAAFAHYTKLVPDQDNSFL